MKSANITQLHLSTATPVPATVELKLHDLGQDKKMRTHKLRHY